VGSNDGLGPFRRINLGASLSGPIKKKDFEDHLKNYANFLERQMFKLFVMKLQMQARANSFEITFEREVQR